LTAIQAAKSIRAITRVMLALPCKSSMVVQVFAVGEHLLMLGNTKLPPVAGATHLRPPFLSERPTHCTRQKLGLCVLMLVCAHLQRQAEGKQACRGMQASVTQAPQLQPRVPRHAEHR